jgi:hypothetical protein
MWSRKKSIFTDLDAFSPAWMRNNYFLNAVCLLVCTDMFSLQSERMDGFYSYSMFTSLFITFRYPANIKILGPKARGPPPGK